MNPADRLPDVKPELMDWNEPPKYEPLPPTIEERICRTANKQPNH